MATFLSGSIGASLSVDRRIHLALELAQCIQYLHRKQIFCSSIHPNSIVITSNQHIKLNVFNANDDFLYVSPERLLRYRNVLPFLDNIYAFGLVLYRLFHTDPNEIEAFHAGKWLLPSVQNINDIDVTKAYYLDYVRQNHSTIAFQIPRINQRVDNIIEKLIIACCSVNVKQRPGMNAIISILNTVKVDQG